MRRTNHELVRVLSGVIALSGFAFVATITKRASAYIDFHAPYCGGAVVNVGLDPYHVEPLRTCEHGSAVYNLPLDFRTPSLGSGHPGRASLPEYDLVALSLLARLPHSQAKLVWQVLIRGCVAITIIAAQRLIRMSPANRIV